MTKIVNYVPAGRNKRKVFVSTGEIMKGKLNFNFSLLFDKTDNDNENLNDNTLH